MRAWPIVVLATGCNLVSGLDEFDVGRSSESSRSAGSSSGGRAGGAGSGAGGVAGSSCAVAMSDTFDDDAIDVSKWEPWQQPGAFVEEAGAQIHVGWQGGATMNAGLLSTPETFLGCEASVRLVLPPGAPSTHAFFFASETPDNRAGFRVADGTLRFVIHGLEPFMKEVPFAADVHAHWRLREADGILEWETSPDGATWTIQASRPIPASLAVPLRINLGAGSTGLEGAAGDAAFDDFSLGG